MGCYVDPPNEDKESWLVRMSSVASGVAPAGLPLDTEYTVVCLIDNGPFRAAGICYNEIELRKFADPYDSRPKMWFVIAKSKIFEIHPEYMGILNAVKREQTGSVKC